MSVDQFVGSLAASAQRLAAGFVSTTESEFVWLKELEAQLGASMDDVEPATESLCLPKTPSAKKRKPRNAAKAKASAKNTTKALRDITQHADKPRRSKRNTSIVPQEAERPATPPTTRRTTRASMAIRQHIQTPPEVNEPSTPETVKKAEAPETPDTIQKSSSTPDTVQRGRAAQAEVAPTVDAPSTAKTDEAPVAKKKAPAPAPRPRRVTRASVMPVVVATKEATPPKPSTPETPQTVNKVEVSATPKARFAAAIAAANTPSTVQRMPFNDPALQPGSVSKTIERLGVGKVGRVGGDLPPPRIKAFDAGSAGKESGKKGGQKRKLYRKGALASPTTGDVAMVTRPAQRVDTLISPTAKADSSAPAPEESARASRKRKSNDEEVDDEHVEPEAGAAATPDGSSTTTETVAAAKQRTYNEMKRDQLQVTRQIKHRKPTKPAAMLRKRARRTEVEHTPGKYNADGTPSHADAGQPPLAPMDLDAATDESEMTDVAAPMASESSARTPLTAREQLNPPSKIATGVKSFVPPTRPASFKSKRAPPAVAALKAAEKQRILAEQKAEERKRRNAEMRAKFYAPKSAAAAGAAVSTPTAAAVGAKTTPSSSGGKTTQKEEEDRAAQEQREREAEAEAKAADARLRRAALAEKEKQVREAMAARKAEIEARQKQFEEKAAKQKAAKLLRQVEQAEMDKARKEKLKRLEEIRLRRQRELEEEARRRDAERAAALAAARTPAVSSAADSYDLSGLVSDASSDEEDNPRAQVPRWAQGVALKSALYNQFIFTPDEKKIRAMFPSPPQPNLNAIFTKGSPRKFRPRTSSAHWEASPGCTLHRK